MNRTAVIYARVSSTSDRQSTDRQVADLRAFAEKEGIEVVGEYEEHGSGAREDRPELLRCVEFLRRGGCSTLLVSEISRLGRTVKGVVNTIDELTKAGVNVYVQDINLWTLLPDGTENPMAKVILTVLASCLYPQWSSFLRKAAIRILSSAEHSLILFLPNRSLAKDSALSWTSVSGRDGASGLISAKTSLSILPLFMQNIKSLTPANRPSADLVSV